MENTKINEQTKVFISKQLREEDLQKDRAEHETAESNLSKIAMSLQTARTKITARKNAWGHYDVEIRTAEGGFLGFYNSYDTNRKEAKKEAKADFMKRGLK